MARFRAQVRRAGSLAVALALLLGGTAPPMAAGSRDATTSLRVEGVLAQMSLGEKVGQLFVSRVYGDQVDETNPTQVRKNRAQLGVANAAELIERYHVGGVIYFRWAGNLATPQSAARLSNGIQGVAVAQANGVPLLISTDQEGGSIVRLRAPATRFAGAMAIGATRRPDLAREAAASIGRELRAVGITQALAPVADVNVNPANPVIGVRSFGGRAGLVGEMTAAQVRGLQLDAGVAATVKHFPGHGDTAVDSHSALPVIQTDATTWRAVHGAPFAAAIDAGTEAIMTAHIAVPALDERGWPATLSAPILTGVLRDEMGFDGVVMTDSLGMRGVREMFGDERVPVLALLAGVDMLLNPPRLALAYDAVLAAVASGELSEARLDASVRRILALKERLGLFDAQQVDVGVVGSIVGSASHRATERAVAEASVTLLRNRAGVLPLDAARSVLVTGWGDSAVAGVLAGLRARGVTSHSLVTGAGPSAPLRQRAVARARDHDVILVITANADTDVGQRKLVAALIGTGKPVVTVAVRRPYDVAWYGGATHICLYSDSAASIAALVGALYADFSPAGRLPVDATRPGRQPVHRFGEGLGYP